MIETKRLLLREYTWKIIMRKTCTKCKSKVVALFGHIIAWLVYQLCQVPGGGVKTTLYPDTQYIKASVHNESEEVVCIFVIQDFRHCSFYIIWNCFDYSFLKIFGIRLAQQDSEGFFIFFYIFKESFNRFSGVEASTKVFQSFQSVFHNFVFYIWKKLKLILIVKVKGWATHLGKITYFLDSDLFNIVRKVSYFQ